jgi:hypothetical protein
MGALPIVGPGAVALAAIDPGPTSSSSGDGGSSAENRRSCPVEVMEKRRRGRGR